MRLALHSYCREGEMETSKERSHLPSLEGRAVPVRIWCGLLSKSQVCGADTQVRYRCAQVCGADTLRYSTDVFRCADTLW